MHKVTRSITWLLLKRNKRFWICLSIELFVLMLALIGPFLTPYKPMDYTAPNLPPLTPGHPFGTDNLGYDVFSATVYGLRVSLAVGLIAAIVATFIGSVFGLISGYKGGLVDQIIDGAANLLLAIPTVFIMIILGTFYLQSEGTSLQYGELQNILFLGAIIGFFSWHWVARAVRSQVVALKVSDYVFVSKLCGNSDLKIMLKDILPNIASYILLVFVIQLANGLATAVTLEFLGIKASEWSLFARVNQWLQMGVLWAGVWWAWFIPGALIVALITSLYLIVLSLDEIFNPRLRKV
ncbi:MAG: ABC transporter permease [Desulfurococcaceae archaeon]